MLQVALRLLNQCYQNKDFLHFWMIDCRRCKTNQELARELYELVMKDNPELRPKYPLVEVDSDTDIYIDGLINICENHFCNSKEYKDQQVVLLFARIDFNIDGVCETILKLSKKGKFKLVFTCSELKYAPEELVSVSSFFQKLARILLTSVKIIVTPLLFYISVFVLFLCRGI